jgi:hypothetical protein
MCEYCNCKRIKKEKGIIIYFKDVKDDILRVVDSRSHKIPQSSVLLDGFFNTPYQKELIESFIIGGPTVPMIAFLCTSGQLYFFALKAILPNLGI